MRHCMVKGCDNKPMPSGSLCEEHKDILAEPKEEPILHAHESVNNGGSTDYYKIPVPLDEHGNPKKVFEAQDVIEHRVMNYAQGNIFKASFCFNTGRHEGTDEIRELNKIIYFAEREIERLKKQK